MTLAPTSIEALRQALADSRPGGIRITGAGTKARGGHDADAGPARLALRGLRGLTSYNPAECVFTALAGTPVAEIADTLAAHGQYLPFDPTHVRAGATIGGAVASGLSGPGRYRYGGVRDFVIGARVVDGQGRLIASGGQVVKNAAGFLTHHALVGSAGRLGAIAEVTFKVFPGPEARATLRAPCASAAAAFAAHERLRAAAIDLEALDLDVAPGGGATVWARLAGAADALAARVARAHALLPSSADVLDGGDDAQAWSAATELAWAEPSASVVKVPLAPSRVLATIDELSGLGRCRVQCGGALLWLATTQPLDEVHAVLAGRGWRGVAAVGAASGRPLGVLARNAFADRVTRALDPDQRFH